MPIGNFQGDPYSGKGTFTGPNGETLEGYLSDFTDNRFYISNGALIDRQDIMNPVSIGRQGDFSFSMLPGNKYQMISQTQRSGVNRPFGTHQEINTRGETVTVPNDFIRLIEGNISYVSAEGTEHVFSISQVPVGGVGAQWITQTRADGSQAYFTVRGNFETNADVEAALNASYRLATPTEAVYAAILKKLMEENPDELRELAEAHGLEDTKDRTKEYFAAVLILEHPDLSNIHFFTSALFE